MKEEECEKKIADLYRQIRWLNSEMHRMISLEDIISMLSDTHHFKEIVEAWPDKGEIDE